jgi:hypothetical protein
MAKNFKEAAAAAGIGAAGYGVYWLWKKLRKRKSKKEDFMNDTNKILGRWFNLETWGEDEIDEYKIDIEQDRQGIILNVEGALEPVIGVLKGRVLKYQYRYEDRHGITENTCEVIFSEDFSSGNFKSTWHGTDGKSGTSDGKWMREVSNVQDLIVNIRELEKYKNSPQGSLEREFYNDLIQAGRCFVVYRTAEGLCFAPIKSISYKDNNMETYLKTRTELRDGRVANKVIEIILGEKKEIDELEKKYESYCRDKCGREPYKHKHTFWVTDIYI